MEILLESTSNKLMVDSILQAGNPVKEILLKLNLPDHRSCPPRFEGYLKMEVKENKSVKLIKKRRHCWQTLSRRAPSLGYKHLSTIVQIQVVRSDLDQGRSYGRLQRYGTFATSPNIFFSGANIILATNGNDDMALKGKNYPQVEDMNVSPLEKKMKNIEDRSMILNKVVNGHDVQDEDEIPDPRSQRIGAAQERGFRDLAIVITCEYSKEEVAEIMEQYMSKTRADYGSGVARPKIEDKDNFKLKGQFLKEFWTNTFSGMDHEDANEKTEKVLKIVDLFHILNITIDQVMLRAFLMSLPGAASRWLRNEPTGSITTWDGLKKISEQILPTFLNCK
ncbi:hypothetical protein Tco_1132861 [Tanacetum coccineum]|uniref:Retrotransposon gag domain-containing protein n=1 Tax=Tanacetum coccineum TaxID=301880 RepID=A0ABQ5JEH5_9ASTR